jgi:hypothetical protein
MTRARRGLRRTRSQNLQPTPSSQKSPAKDEQPKPPTNGETLYITWPFKDPTSDADLRALIVKPTAAELEKVAKQNADADKNGYMRIKPHIPWKNPFEALRAQPEASIPEAKLKYCNELLLKCYETEDVVFAHHKFLDGFKDCDKEYYAGDCFFPEDTIGQWWVDAMAEFKEKSGIAYDSKYAHMKVIVEWYVYEIGWEDFGGDEECVGGEE